MLLYVLAAETEHQLLQFPGGRRRAYQQGTSPAAADPGRAAGEAVGAGQPVSHGASKPFRQ